MLATRALFNLTLAVSHLLNQYLTFFVLYTQMISLYWDPKGEEIFSGMDPSKRTENKDNHNSMAASLSELKDSEKVVILNSQVARLKETLNDKNRRTAELESIVNK